MARANEFVDHDYDRRLAEYKEMRDKLKREQGEPKKENNPQRRSF